MEQYSKDNMINYGILVKTKLKLTFNRSPKLIDSKYIVYTNNRTS